jgi:hypothetical protein
MQMAHTSHLPRMAWSAQLPPAAIQLVMHVCQQSVSPQDSITVMLRRMPTCLPKTRAVHP